MTNWFDRIGVAEILLENSGIKNGDSLIAIGATTGAVEFEARDIRVNFEPVATAPKGSRCSVRVEAPGRLHRGDKVYLWQETCSKEESV